MSAALEIIRNRAADLFDVDPAHLLGNRRTQKVVNARYCAAYLAREITSFSMQEIAECAGYANHSSARYAADHFEVEISKDADLNARILSLAENLRDEIKHLQPYRRVGRTGGDLQDTLNIVSDIVRRHLKLAIAEATSSILHEEARKRSVLEDELRLERLRNQHNSLPNGTLQIIRSDRFAKEVAEIAAAVAMLEQDRFSLGEKLARKRLDKAVNALAAAFEAQRKSTERSEK
ncbi:MAG: hypothetical protein OXR62_11000 [Ahrensia sp.]|nr:hypothetical protein [Ahrensia sp.]